MKLTNELVLNIAKELGFDLVGFAKVEVLQNEIDKLEQWLASGFQAGMQYMERNVEKRKDVRYLLPDAKSIISLGINYFQDGDYSDGKAKVSRYAWGKDYHLIIWDKLEKLQNALAEINPEFKAKSFVDTGPVMDKAWAIKSGLGWMGKHTNVINPQYGSWLFLSTLITNYEFDYSPVIEDFCGSCTRCMDACPTNALSSYILDANKCISYLTIENKEEIPERFSGKFDNWVFGCDICQDVCPWNIKFAQVNNKDEFSEKVNVEFEIEELILMGEEEFRLKFRYSPIKRAKLKGIKRNSKFIQERQ